MKQVDKMRQLYIELGGDESKTISAYAAAERRGEVKRKSNKHGLDSETYSRALYLDGIRKGWLTG